MMHYNVTLYMKRIGKSCKIVVSHVERIILRFAELRHIVLKYDIDIIMIDKRIVIYIKKMCFSKIYLEQ